MSVKDGPSIAMLRLNDCEIILISLLVLYHALVIVLVSGIMGGLSRVIPLLGTPRLYGSQEL